MFSELNRMRVRKPYFSKRKPTFFPFLESVRRETKITVPATINYAIINNSMMLKLFRNDDCISSDFSFYGISEFYSSSTSILSPLKLLKDASGAR